MRIQSHEQLEVFRKAMDVAMRIFALSKKFPQEEIYSLTNQIRRSSRSVCANLAEGWRKRRYEGSFIAKLSDAEAEAVETQVWLEFALKCAYLDPETVHSLRESCDEIIRMLVTMINNSKAWIIPETAKR